MRLPLSRKTLTFLVVLGGLIFLVSALLLIDYVNSKFNNARLETEKRSLLAQNARLAERNREKDQQLAAISDKMRSIELTMERIEEMEGHVRILGGMEDTTRPLISEGGPVTPRLGQTVSQADVAQLYASAHEVMERMGLHRVALSKVARYFSERRSEVLQIPNRWPLKGWVTSLFGMRISPFTGSADMHDGLDIAAPEGAVIRAPASGTVVFDGVQSGYGNVVILRHGRGITTVFGHLAKSLAAIGTRLPAGAPIGLVGNTGRSTGPHLHYEVRLNDIPVNPMRFLPSETESVDSAAAAQQTEPTPEPSSVWPASSLPLDQPAAKPLTLPGFYPPEKENPPPPATPGAAAPPAPPVSAE